MIRIISFALVVLMLTQVVCARPVEDKESAVEWFKSNHVELSSLLDKVLSHPTIQRVEDMKMDFIPKYGEFSQDDIQAYRAALEMSDELGIKAIYVSRKGNSADGDLLGVDMVLISEGLTTKGYALTVEYIPNPNYVEKAKEHGILYYPLGVENWYLAEYINN